MPHEHAEKNEQSNETRSKLHSALDKFLTSDKTRPENKHALLKYLTERPYSIPPVDLIPIHEIEERLDFAQHVRGFVQNCQHGFPFPFPASSLSVLMVTPWEDIPSVKSHLTVSTAQDIYNELEYIHMLTTYCKVYC